MERPRLLFAGQSVKALRAKTGHLDIAPAYQRLISYCDVLLEEPPVQPPEKPSTNEDRSGHELGRARRGQCNLVSLGLAYLLTERRQYLDRAWTEMECWTDVWTSWTDPCHGRTDFYDLTVAEIGLALAISYDWLEDSLQPHQRDKLRDHLAYRVLDLYLANTEEPKAAWWFRTYHNWNTVCNGAAIVTALALEKDYAASEEVIGRATKSWILYFDALRREGGCDEGTGYWTYGMKYAAMALQALMERGWDVSDVMNRPGMELTGRFPVSFCPDGVAVSWGDAGAVSRDPVLYLLARWYRSADFVRYLDRIGSRAGLEPVWPSEAMAVLWRPVDEEWLPAPDSNFTMDTTVAYREIGWSVVTDRWTDPSFIAGFKCGDLGANHTHLDNNTFQLWFHGEWLAVDHGGGVYNAEYFSEKRWDLYVVGTGSHNGLLIDGRGQTPRTQGRLEPVVLSQNVAVFVGDATACYGRREVKKARRHFAVVRRRYVVCVDEVETEAPETIEWRLHTEHSVKVEDQWRARVEGKRSVLHVAFPPGSVMLRVDRDFGELPPGKSAHVLRAKQEGRDRAKVLPALLFPAEAEGKAPAPKVEFMVTTAGCRVTVRHSGGTDVLSWNRTRDGLKFAGLS